MHRITRQGSCGRRSYVTRWNIAASSNFQVADYPPRASLRTCLKALASSRIHASPRRRDTSNQAFRATPGEPSAISTTRDWSKGMRVDLVQPESDTEPRHWVRHDQAFAMMLRPGSIEWGSKRSALEKFNYGAGDLALCDRHVGEWVGLMNVQHLQIGISDAALMASSDGAYGEVELRASRKFADRRLSAHGCGRSCGNGCRLSERAAVSGFRRTGDGRSTGQWIMQ